MNNIVFTCDFNFLQKLPPHQLRQYAPMGTTVFVSKIEEVTGKNLMNYRPNDQKLLKIYVVSPKMINACKFFCLFLVLSVFGKIG